MPIEKTEKYILIDVLTYLDPATDRRIYAVPVDHDEFYLLKVTRYSDLIYGYKLLTNVDNPTLKIKETNPLLMVGPTRPGVSFSPFFTVNDNMVKLNCLLYNPKIEVTQSGYATAPSYVLRSIIMGDKAVYSKDIRLEFPNDDAAMLFLETQC